MNLLNDTSISSPSPLEVIGDEMDVGHHETIHTGNFHRKGYLKLHHLAGATIQVANLVNYICHLSRSKYFFLYFSYKYLVGMHYVQCVAENNYYAIR